jgi:protein subunit release factor A
MAKKTTLEQKFSNLIREKLSDDQVYDYVGRVKDKDELCKGLEEWFSKKLDKENQELELKELEEIIKENEKPLERLIIMRKAEEAHQEIMDKRKENWGEEEPMDGDLTEELSIMFREELDKLNGNK